MSTSLGASRQGPLAARGDTAPLDVPDHREAYADGDRGGLEIDPRVVQKVAAYAVREVDRASGTPRTVAGVPVMGTADDANVKARVEGSLVTLTVELALDYPSPVRYVVSQTRSHVARRVHEMTGLDVREVDVYVRQMKVGSSSSQPRVI